MWRFNSIPGHGFPLQDFMMTLSHTTLVRTPLKEQFVPSQRPLPDNTQQSQETDIHAPGGIRTRNPSKRAAAGPCLRSANRRTYWK